MKHINLLSGDYLFVGVPDDAYDFEILISASKHVINDRVEFKIPAPPNQTKWGWYDKTVKLRNGKHQIISTTKDITEEICKNLIDDCDIYAKCWKKYTYKGAKDIGGQFNSDYSCWTAKESLNSLLQSVGLDLDKNYLILKKS